MICRGEEGRKASYKSNEATLLVSVAEQWASGVHNSGNRNLRTQLMEIDLEAESDVSTDLVGVVEHVDWSTHIQDSWDELLFLPLGPDAIDVGVVKVEDWVVWRVAGVTHGSEKTSNTKVSSSVEVLLRPAWQSLKSASKLLVVWLGHDLIDDAVGNVFLESGWAKVTNQAVRVGVSDVCAGTNVEGEVDEWAVGNTASSGAVIKTDPVLVGGSWDPWSVSSESVDWGEDVVLRHLLGGGGILRPVPVWLGTSVATLLAESLLVGPEVVSVPWEEVTDEVDVWSLSVVDTGEVVVSVFGSWD